MKKKDFFYLSIIIVLLIIGYLRYKYQKYTDTQSQILMDTMVEISATSPEKNVAKTIHEAFNIMSDYNNKLSYFKVNNYIWKVNHTQAAAIKMDPDLYQMLKISKPLYIQSDSLYDLTIGALTDIWPIPEERIPSQQEIDQAKKQIGFYQIHFSKKELRKPPLVRINLGSIAKGYIVDRAVEFLMKHNVTSGYVNAGGNIRLFGSHKKEVIGIQHPRNKDQVIGTLVLSNAAIATSGDYERYFIKNNVRYHHILDPKTGYPSTQSMAVTVVAPDAVTADAFSTTLFLLGPVKGLELLKKYPDIQAVFFYEAPQKQIAFAMTPGMKNIFHKAKNAY